jgi:hypothetical protein
MIVVAVASLISALVAYECRMKGRARYHETKYLELITPISPQARSRGGIEYRSKLVDGTWSVPHYKTPDAEWHEQRKWEYLMEIERTHLILVAAIAGSVSLWLACRTFLIKTRRSFGASGDP